MTDDALKVTVGMKCKISPFLQLLGHTCVEFINIMILSMKKVKCKISNFVLCQMHIWSSYFKWWWCWVWVSGEEEQG